MLTLRSYNQAVAAIDDYLNSDSQNKEALAIKIRLLQCQHRVAYAKHVAKSLLMLGGDDSTYLDVYGNALLQAILRMRKPSFCGRTSSTPMARTDLARR